MADDKLKDYRAKRDFKTTPEPVEGGGGEGKKFVIQRHQASHLHYDLRLEMGGVLKSWAVPKGPPVEPKEKRLAIEVEDHPLAYGDFEGTIPEGQYGAGTVEIWDSGTFEPLDDGDPQDRLKAGKLAFMLKGKRLNGRFALVKTSFAPKSWLFIAHDDDSH
ncbi:MAG: DNA polymerase ligase N-terminal domain-containing protein [Actinomycetota bacterium]|nr:DNA polymerase ligase N-terminal domain-containing protein [Actinomycetota bacterium]